MLWWLLGRIAARTARSMRAVAADIVTYGGLYVR